jgi:hypothetical protein
VIETWKDAFTIVGGFVATAATAITIHRGTQPEKPQFAISAEEKAALSDSICKLLQYYNDINLAILGLKKDNEHFKEKLDDMATHAERDHKEVKKLTLILYPLIKSEIADYRRKMGLTGSATETDEI